MSLFLYLPISADFAHISIFGMPPINNRTVLEKWLIKIITTTTVWNLQLRNQWIPTHLMYKHYCNGIKNAMPLGAFTRALGRISELSNIKSNIFISSKKGKEGQKITFMLILQKAVCTAINICDYSTFTGSSFLFTPTRSTNILPNSKVSQPFPTEDTPVVSTIEYDPQNIQGRDVGSPRLTDPLLILAEVAVSSPSNSMNFQTITTNNNHVIPLAQPSSKPTQHPTTSSEYIQFSQLLNIDSNPRICPISRDPIPICTDAVRNGSKWSILATMLEFEYKKMSTSEKKRIIHAVATYYSFYGGYSCVICSYSTFR